MKTFSAPDMRTALRLVREEFGADAVILSNRRVDGGIELLATADMPPPAPSPAAMATPFRSAPVQSAPAQPLAATAPLSAPAAPVAAVPGEFADVHASAPAARGEAGWWQMQQELHTLRDLLEQQFSNFAWHDYRTTQPGSAAMWRRLQRLGLPTPLIARLLESCEGTDLSVARDAWQILMKKLSDAIPVADSDLLADGGTFAFVGPTGAGKTTTIGKLAARHVLEHGPADVALVTMDSFRIGAHEQLRTLARILGVPFKIAASPQALAGVLYELRHCRLILIDTAGLNARAPELQQQLAALHALGDRVRCLQVLPANTHQGALKTAAGVYRTGNLCGCVLTKLDEAGTLGEVLGQVILSALPVAYTTDGQNIPGDLAVASARALVTKAIAFARNADADEASLAQAFGDFHNTRNSLSA